VTDRQDPIRGKVVDLRRWREQKAREALPEEPRRAGPPRRLFGVAFGGFFLALGGLLFWVLLATPRHGAAPLPWALFVVPAGIALLGLDLLVRAGLGRRGARALGSWLDDHVQPAPTLAVMAAAAIGCGLWRGRGDPAAWAPAVYLATALFHVVFHEAGHLAAVNQARYIPHRLLAGPLHVRFEGLRPRFGLNRDWRFVYAGRVLYTPVFATRGKDLAIALAGPAANLLALAFLLPLVRWPAAAGPSALLARANLVCAAAVLVMNLLPLPRSFGGFATDGRQILDLLRGRKVA